MANSDESKSSRNVRFKGLVEGLPDYRGIGFKSAVMEIGPDYVLGTWQDDLGVEQVRLYRLIKE